MSSEMGFRLAAFVRVERRIALQVLLFATLACLAPPGSPARAVTYPESPLGIVADTLHGVVVPDPYRWLEDGTSPQVKGWAAEQEKLTRSLLDPLPQRAWALRRLEALWRYDDEGTPEEVIESPRFFYWVKKKTDEKDSYWTKPSPAAPGRELINPNTWPADDGLEGFYPSRDGKYVVFGRAHGGDETPVLRVMEVDTGRILPDSLRGWRQGDVYWLPQNAGFYYSANPKKGEVPDGEEFYWPRVYYHALGAQADQDTLVFSHPTVKEYHHACSVSEDGRYLIYWRFAFGSKMEIFFKAIDSHGPPIPLATGLDAEYSVDFVGDRIYITTDSGAPMLHVFMTDAAHPGRESWKEIIREDKERKLGRLQPIAGKLYGVYDHKAYTQIKIFDADGRFLRDLPLPAIGSASVSGYWSKPTVWVDFSSFAYPPVTFTYDYEQDRLSLYKKFPLDIDVTAYTVEQAWYPSKDGTQVSMFLIHRKDLQKSGRNPVFLTGYGGFNIPMNPYFSRRLFTWLEAGGMVAFPNLRGGGEYGKEWHQAGMLEKKQNVFDDFIAAAEWLIQNGYTSPEHLAIEGGSNGGLLVGAVEVQRPELFRAVLCEMPLLDMLRYHKFGYANIWAEEYGNADDPEQFAYIRDYSPYQNVREGIRYPETLIVAGENDSRVDPLHARKMVARLQAADRGGGPILLLVEKASGHIGGARLTAALENAADGLAFLMNALGLQPEGK